MNVTCLNGYFTSLFLMVGIALMYYENINALICVYICLELFLTPAWRTSWPISANTTSSRCW